MDLPIATLRCSRPDVFSSEKTCFSDLDEEQVQTILCAMRSMGSAQRRSNPPRIADEPTIDAGSLSKMRNAHQMEPPFNADIFSMARIRGRGRQIDDIYPRCPIPTQPETWSESPVKADVDVQTTEDPRLVELRSRNAVLQKENAELKSQLKAKETKFESMKTETEKIRNALFRHFRADSSSSRGASNEEASCQTDRASTQHIPLPSTPRTRSSRSVQNPPSVAQTSTEMSPRPMARPTESTQRTGSVHPETDFVPPLPPIQTHCVDQEMPNTSSLHSWKDERDLSQGMIHSMPPPLPLPLPLPWVNTQQEWDTTLSSTQLAPAPFAVSLPPPIFGCASPKAIQRSAPVAISVDKMAIVGGLIEGKEASTVGDPTLILQHRELTTVMFVCAYTDGCFRCWTAILAQCALSSLRFDSSQAPVTSLYSTGVSFLWGGAALIREHLFLIGGINGSMPIDLVRHYSFRSSEHGISGIAYPTCRLQRSGISCAQCQFAGQASSRPN